MTPASSPILERVRASGPQTPIPSADELKRSLQEHHRCVGDRAFSGFEQAQRLAATVWGAEQTSHFAMVLREMRVTTKPAKADRWDRARHAASQLPAPWDRIFFERIVVSERGERCDRDVVLSANYLETSAQAWSRWLSHCDQEGVSEQPTGTMLEGYAYKIMHKQEEPVSLRSCASYLGRIMAAYRLRDPEFTSTACDFVVTRYLEAGKAAGTPTKTGNQIVGASEIYRLGFELMDDARERSFRGIRAAVAYRNGLMLAVGIALPQRARALSVLEFEKTLLLPEPDVIHVQLPGMVLKLPEAEKADGSYERMFRNPGLYAALVEYRCDFRPLFDPGMWLFPSVHDRTAAIAKQQVGKLSGDMTEGAFGVRIPIHRFRDNVGTEASEELEIGPRAVPSLLGHGKTTTGQRHYDHSQGIAAAMDHEAFLDGRRSNPCDLRI